MTQDIGQKRMDRMNKAIEDSELKIKKIMDMVNGNYRNFLSANIAYHRQLRDMAEQAGDMSARCATR